MMSGYNDTKCFVAMTTRMQQNGCQENHYMSFWLSCQQRYNGMVAMETILKVFLVAMATSLYSHKFGSTYIVQLTISVVYLLHFVACNHKRNIQMCCPKS